MNPTVDFYFEKQRWHKELLRLRDIAIGCGLTETLKWGVPCYMLGKSNVVLIHDFKEYCALLFFKGALLQDPAGILIRQSQQVQSARQIRFTCEREIIDREDAIKACIDEAIAVEKAGLKVVLKKTDAYPVPEEFQSLLDKSDELRLAFQALTPGRQRGYLLYFSQAKQAKTREARVQKYVPWILAGKGLND